MKASLLHNFLTSLLLLIPEARGDYILRAQVYSYSNPTSRCAGCGPQQACCDNFECGPNTNKSRCDNEFFHCVRPLGTPEQTLWTLINTVPERSVEDRARALQCMQPPAAFRSNTNEGDYSVDYFGPMFLGIPNPMEFQVNTSKWEGIQFYLDVIDRDTDSLDDVIDTFTIGLEASFLPAGRGMSELQVFFGRFRFASAILSFEVECLPGFVGETCVHISQICNTDPCSNNGTCLQSASGFTCSCRGDFTGETCETRINDCQDVDCNDGTCVDEVQSFTCQCEEEFSGEFCQQRIPMTTTSAATSDNIGVGASSSNVGAVAGTVSVLLLVILITAICLIIALKKLHPWARGADSEDIPTVENVVYGIVNAAARTEDIPTTVNMVYGIKGGRTADGEDIPTTLNVVYGIKGGRTADGEDIPTTPNVVYGVKVGGIKDRDHKEENYEIVL